MNLKTALLIFIVSFTLNAQTIGDTPFQNFTNHPCFSPQTLQMYLSDEESDSIALKHFLHELGHFVWLYSDTVSYKKEFREHWEILDYTDLEIQEDFADNNYYYFLGVVDKNDWEYKYFYDYYNREGK